MTIPDFYPLSKYYYNSTIALHELPEEDYKLLTRNMVTYTYKKGEVIFRDGSYPTGVYYIEKGFVKRYKNGLYGNDQIVYVCTIGELLGCHNVLCDDKYLDSAAALEESVICFIPKEDFLEAIDKSSAFTSRVLKAFGHMFGMLVDTVTIQGQYQVREKLIFTLIYLHEKYKQAGYCKEEHISISISRTDLASMVGTSKETVVRFLRELKDMNLINSKGTAITINDIRQLVKLLNR